MSAKIVAEYGKPGEMLWRRVLLDADAGTVIFERCHIPNRFLSLWPEPEFTCSSADIRATSWRSVREVGPILLIVTRQGRARLPQSATGFEEVRSVIAVWAKSAGTGLAWHELAAVRIVLSLVAVVVAVFLGLAVIVSELLPAWAIAGMIFSPLILFLSLVIFSAVRRKPLW